MADHSDGTARGTQTASGEGWRSMSTPVELLVPEPDRLLVRGEHHDPHAILGAHRLGGSRVVAFHPEAISAELLTGPGQAIRMGSLGEELWMGRRKAWRPAPPIGSGSTADGADWERDDPYRFLPTLGEPDLHPQRGHPRTPVGGARRPPARAPGRGRSGLRGLGPNARSVRGRRLRPLGRAPRCRCARSVHRACGSCSCRASVRELYKYEVLGADGKLRVKADPLSFSQQVRPETASRVWDIGVDEGWTDDAWMADRAGRDPYRSPMSVYEVHLGSWRRNADGSWLGYRQAAEQLAEHCHRFGFTHVELPLVASIRSTARGATR